MVRDESCTAVRGNISGPLRIEPTNRTRAGRAGQTREKENRSTSLWLGAVASMIPRFVYPVNVPEARRLLGPGRGRPKASSVRRASSHQNGRGELAPGAWKNPATAVEGRGYVSA